MKRSIFLIVTLIFLLNTKLCKANDIYDMPLNNVISICKSSYYDAFDYGVAFIKEDNSAWLNTEQSNLKDLKIDDNVVSIKTDIHRYVFLKDDKSVWSCFTAYDNGVFKPSSPEKEFDNVKMIDMSDYGRVIYMLKYDNSLWGTGHITHGNNMYGYETYGDGLYRKTQDIRKTTKIMEDIAYIKMTPIIDGYGYTEKDYNTFLILKTDGSLWQSSVDNINIPQKIMSNVSSFDICGQSVLAIKKNGGLYAWNYKNIKNKSNIIKIMDDIKYAKFSSDTCVNVLENNGTVWELIWETKIVDNAKHITKIADNVKYIVGDSKVYFIDNNGKVFIDAFGRMDKDYEIKVPTFNEKEKIILTEDELNNYIKITKDIKEKEKNLASELNNTVNKMTQKGILSKEEKRVIDSKIKDYEVYAQQNKNKIILNASDTEKNKLKIYTNEVNKDIYYDCNDKTLLDTLKENSYDIDNNSYLKARRYYAINSLCYANDWRNLSSYVTNIFKNDKDKSDITITIDNYDLFYNITEFLNFIQSKSKPINKNIDGLEITKRQNIYNINLNNVKSYEILNPSEETYGYYLFKIITNNNTTYIITGFNDNIDYYNGYMYPTGNGTAIEQGSMGNNILVLDTSEIIDTVDGEMYSLNDILDMYIRQDKTNWNYKDVNITRGKNKEYIIKIKDGKLIDGEGSSYINKWIYHDKGEFLKQLTSSCFKINGKNTKYLYSMNDINMLGYKVVENKSKLDESEYTSSELNNIKDFNDYKGAIDYYIKDEKVYIKHKNKNIILMSE